MYAHTHMHRKIAKKRADMHKTMTIFSVSKIPLWWNCQDCGTHRNGERNSKFTAKKRLRDVTTTNAVEQSHRSQYNRLRFFCSARHNLNATRKLFKLLSPFYFIMAAILNRFRVTHSQNRTIARCLCNQLFPLTNATSLYVVATHSSDLL